MGRCPLLGDVPCLGLAFENHFEPDFEPEDVLGPAASEGGYGARGYAVGGGGGGPAGPGGTWGGCCRLDPI